MNKKEFAEIVRSKRKELGFTKSAFSDLLGVSWITIWRWETQKETPNKIIMKLWADKIRSMKK